MQNVLRIARAAVLPVVAAFACGYGFTWGLSAIGIVTLVFVGMEFHAADISFMLMGFPVLLATFLWTFVSRQRVWVGAGLLGVGVLMGVTASWLQSTMIG